MAGAGLATESFVRRHQMLSLAFWVTLLFSILFAMAAMDVTGQCYVDPCSSDSPAVTSGMSLVTALAAFLFIAQVPYRMYLCMYVYMEFVYANTHTQPYPVQRWGRCSLLALVLLAFVTKFK